MFVEIHFPQELPVDRDDLEEAIADALAGRGEVTGAGTGVHGTNLDLTVSGIDETEARQLLSRALRPFALQSARARFDGQRKWVSLVGET